MRASGYQLVCIYNFLPIRFCNVQRFSLPLGHQRDPLLPLHLFDAFHLLFEILEQPLQLLLDHLVAGDGEAGLDPAQLGEVDGAGLAPLNAAALLLQNDILSKLQKKGKIALKKNY